MNKVASVLLWPVTAIVGAFSFAALALGRGESVSAIWLVTAAVCVYFIAYRFYGKFIADKVLRLDDTRQTPAERRGGPAGRPGAGGADGLLAWHPVDSRRCSGRGRGAGF